MRKATVLILLLIVTVLLNAFEPDKGAHAAGIASLYILTDCLCEWTGCPRYVPIILCVGVSFGKEYCDTMFNWHDIAADGAGLVFGFSVRFADFRRR